MIVRDWRLLNSDRLEAIPAALAKLPEMRKEFKSLRAAIVELEKSLAANANQKRRTDHAA